jgi:CheY-like chemotaxis protein
MSSTVGDPKKLVVLLAEDSPAEQRLAQRALERDPLHCELRMVSDGQEAMDYLLHRPPYEKAELAPRPHLLLLDLNMPKLDGRQVLREIKSNPELATIPVVVLTTSKQEQDILQSYHLGCNSFINKPVDVHEFFDMMRTLSRYWLDLVMLPPNKG